jgi:hypothetical protein
LTLLVGSFSETVLPTRRCGSAFPLAARECDEGLLFTLLGN